MGRSRSLLRIEILSCFEKSRWRIFVSSQPCSLAIEVEQVNFDQRIEQPFALLVNKRYDNYLKESSVVSMASNDVVELGGSLTVSF